MKQYTYELYHHGIKGQKWGVRRYQNKDGSLTPSGSARYSGNKSKQKTKKDTGRDHSKSNKFELGLYLTNLGLDIATLNPVGLAIDTQRLVLAGKSYVRTSMSNKEREGCKIDSKTGFRLKNNKSFDMKDDAFRVNPAIDNFDKNTKNNCMLCTGAYDLRRRGYEVRAKKASYGYHSKDIKAWYPKAKLQTIEGINEKGKPDTKTMMTKVKSELVKQGNGARGNLMITWKGLAGGHSVAYEVKNNNLIIVDAQVNKVYTNPDSFLKRCSNKVEYARLDNVDFNVKNIKEVAE